ATMVAEGRVRVTGAVDHFSGIFSKARDGVRVTISPTGSLTARVGDRIAMVTGIGDESGQGAAITAVSHYACYSVIAEPGLILVPNDGCDGYEDAPGGIDVPAGAFVQVLPVPSFRCAYPGDGR